MPKSMFFDNVFVIRAILMEPVHSGVKKFFSKKCYFQPFYLVKIIICFTIFVLIFSLLQGIRNIDKNHHSPILIQLQGEILLSIFFPFTMYESRLEAVTICIEKKILTSSENWDYEGS